MHFVWCDTHPMCSALLLVLHTTKTMGCATIALQFTKGIIKRVNINVDLNGTIGNKNSKRRQNIPSATSWDKEVGTKN